MQRDPTLAVQEIKAAFPRLTAEGYEITSEFDSGYNGIAFAADDQTRWWWPDQYGLGYWPPTIPRQATLPRFIEAFATLGYAPCDSPDPEDDYEKVALYSLAAGEPKHAARQLPSGVWASKLGEMEDIEHHTLTGIEGDAYGYVAQILRRVRQQNARDDWGRVAREGLMGEE